jgi:hypothetical protein
MSELFVNGKPIPYDTVPVSYMADSFRLYFERGISPGSFGAALLCNDLRESFARADDTNSQHIRQWVQWLYDNAPNSSWGSREKFFAWMKSRQSKEENDNG